MIIILASVPTIPINSKKFFWILGVLSGDGFILGKKQIGLDCTSKEFAYKFKNYCVKLFNLNPSFFIRKNLKYKCNCLYCCRVSSVILSRYILNNYGSFRTKEWKLPLFKSKKQIRQFLIGYFDSEGCIDIKGQVIEFTSINQELIKIKDLFKQLDINSYVNINKEGTTQYNDIYKLRIKGLNNIYQFYKQIHPSIKEKQTKLKRLLFIKSNSIQSTQKAKADYINWNHYFVQWLNKEKSVLKIAKELNFSRKTVKTKFCKLVTNKLYKQISLYYTKESYFKKSVICGSRNKDVVNIYI